MGPLPREVERAGIRGLKEKSLPYEVHASDFFEPLERLKQLFSKLIDSDDPQRIAFQPSVSYGIATVVKNLPLKLHGNLVLVRDQFPSNVLAFQDFAMRESLEIRFVDPPKTFDNRTEKWNQKIIEAIDRNTICVACGPNHWADGTQFDLSAIREVTQKNEALLIIDGTQSIGALPFSVQEIRPDALLCAGYKFLLGPYSSALAYFGPRFDLGQPIEHNWINRKNSEQFGRLIHYEPEFREKAFRYNVGECSNFIAVPMLIKSITQILDWGVSNIQNYCRELTKGIIRSIQDQGYSVASTGRSHHLFGLYLPAKKSMTSLQEKLRQENVFVSLRGNSVRISPHVYNTAEDMEKLTHCLIN